MGGLKKINKRYVGPVHQRVRCPECNRDVSLTGGKIRAHGPIVKPCGANNLTVREYIKLKSERVDVIKAEAANGSFAYLDLKGQKVDSNNVNVLFTVPATVKAVKSF